MRITLLYESPSGDGANVLTAEQLGAVHAAERRLWQWARDEGVCWADAACVCRPFDSLVSYLYPQVCYCYSLLLSVTVCYCLLLADQLPLPADQPHLAARPVARAQRPSGRRRRLRAFAHSGGRR